MLIIMIKFLRGFRKARELIISPTVTAMMRAGQTTFYRSFFQFRYEYIIVLTVIERMIIDLENEKSA